MAHLAGCGYPGTVTVGFSQRSTDVEAAISRYQPVKNVDPWPDIKDFVCAAVRDCQQMTAYSSSQLLIVASAHIRWCHQMGYALDRDVAFRRQLIGEFIHRGLTGVSVATAGNYRSKLLRMSNLLVSPQYRTEPLPSICRNNAAEPYTREEVAMLRSWVAGQHTEYRRANAAAMTALCLGAGLSAAELSFVTPSHIMVDDEGVLVRVEGYRPRIVPVMAEWEGSLIQSAEAAADPSQFLFRADRLRTHRHLVSNFVDKTISCGVRPSSQRMRATWLVTHMLAGVRADVILAAAGVESLEALTRYLQYMPSAEAAAARQALRSSFSASHA